jgi:hypothetical protein
VHWGEGGSSSRILDSEKYMTVTEISEEQCICISRHYVLCTVILQEIKINFFHFLKYGVFEKTCYIKVFIIPNIYSLIQNIPRILLIILKFPSFYIYGS